MKLFYSLLFVLVGTFPALALGQTIAQLQVGALATSSGEYSVGETISGSATINNIGVEAASEIYYQVSYGEYGEKGGNLISTYTSNDLMGPLYIESGQSIDVDFTIKPEAAVANAGIDIVVTHQNGGLLAWKKIPVKITGATATSSDMKNITSALEVDGEEFPLMSGPTAYPDAPANILISGVNENLDGNYSARLVIYDRSMTGEKVYDQAHTIVFESGVASLALPTEFMPESYIGTLVLENGGKQISNIINFRYIIGGAQAEIIDVVPNKLSVKDGEQFNVQVAYSGTPLNINGDEAPELLQSPAIRVSVKNEEGKEIANYNGALEMGEYASLEELQSMTEEEATAYLEEQIGETLDSTVEMISLTANGEARSMSISVDIYNSETGEVYDTYSTSLPEEGAKTYGLMDYIVWLLIIVVTVLFVIIIRMFIKGKRTPAVAGFIIALGLVGSITVLTKYNQAEAFLTTEGGSSNGTLSISSPISSRVGGYDPGESIDLDMSYTVWACANNGNIKLSVFKPKTNNWHSFTSTRQAIDHIKAAMPSKSWSWEIVTIPGCTPTGRTRCYYVSWVKVPADTTHYEDIVRTTNTWKDSGAYFGNTFLNIAGGLTAPSSPGKYYVPFTSQYCTASHGCAKRNYHAFEICVNGAGLCPGEGSDVCSNVPGNQTSTGGIVYDEDGSTTDYVVNADGTCSHSTCPPGVTPPANLGQTCGCNGEGTVQCDGSCRTPGGQSIPAECIGCSNEYTEGQTCTTTDSCGPIDGAWQCTPTGWNCNANSTRTCGDDNDLCNNVSGIQLTVPDGYTRNSDGSCSITDDGCALANPGQSYCIQLFDENGNPTYEDSGVDAGSYNEYFRDLVEGSSYYIGGAVVTDHNIYGIIDGGTGGRCGSDLCTPSSVAHKTGCINNPQPARCYSEPVDNPYNVSLDLRTYPDVVPKGQFCNIVWTSQDTEYCNLTTSQGGGVTSFSTAGSHAVLMGDESVTVTLSCRSLDTSDGTVYAKQSTCKLPGQFSEF